MQGEAREKGVAVVVRGGETREAAGGDSPAGSRQLMDAVSILDIFAPSEAKVEERDGLIWKDLLYTCNIPGNEWIPELTIDKQMLEDIKAAFDVKVLPHVDVPVGTHDVDPVDRNSGFVQGVEIRSGENGSYHLWVGIKFTEPEIEAKIRNGTIANISARLEKDFRDPVTGQTWPWVLWHAALTNKPVLKGLKPFLVASFNGLQLQGYRKEGGAMPDKVTPAGAEAGEAKGTTGTVLSLTPEELEKIKADEREAIRLQVKAETEAATSELRSRANAAEAQLKAQREVTHGMAVKSLLLALQGRGDDEKVRLPQGHAFAATVVKAAEPFLRADLGQEKSIRLSMDGKEEAFSVTDVVLSVLNAVAEAKDGAVVSLAQHGVQKHDAPASGATPTNADKDKAVDGYLESRPHLLAAAKPDKAEGA